MKTRLLLVILCAWPLLSCQKLVIPETSGCAVAGVMAAGANCASTASDKTWELTLTEFIYFLEPDPATHKPAAICRSAEDEMKIKTVIEQACELLKDRCTLEMKALFKDVVRREGNLNGLRKGN